MTNLNCEWVRDVYPDVLNGKVDQTTAEAVRTHAVSCDECRADISLLGAIHAEETLVPAGLHERVVHAAARPTLRFRVPAGRIAMAATIAAAMIGGSVLLHQISAPAPTARPATASAPAHQSVGSVSVEDAMLSGKASLDDLTVEELEKLLGETRS